MTRGGEGFDADPELLRGGASEVLKCLNPAKGADFESLGKDFEGSDQGNLILSGKFEKFCDTWEMAHLVLGDRAADAAEKLKKLAHNYEQADEHAERQLPPYGPGR